jgi:hypothetical protein
MADLWRAGLAEGNPREHPGLPILTRRSFASAELARIRDSLGYLFDRLQEVPVLMILVVRVADRGRGSARCCGPAPERRYRSGRIRSPPNARYRRGSERPAWSAARAST